MRSSSIYKLLFIGLIILIGSVMSVYGVVFLRGFREYRQLSLKADRLEHQLNEVTTEVTYKEEYLNRLVNDPEFLNHVTQQRLGFAAANEIVFRFPSENKQAKQ
jgi:cell division protein FtsB